MSSEFSFSAGDFSGVSRLFPLPDHVMFPHVVQPFHIFEDRYRDLTAAALDGDKLITVVQLANGWESDYNGRPATASVGCLGRICTHARLDDGRYNLLVAGLRRVRIASELEPRHAFREAEVELMEDVYLASGKADRTAVQGLLLNRFRSFLPQAVEAREQYEELFSGQISLGALTDIVAYSLTLTSGDKQLLLDEVNVDRRAIRLIYELDCLMDEPITDSFPPQFSAN